MRETPAVTVLITMTSHEGKRDELAEQAERIAGEAQHEDGAIAFSYGFDADRMTGVETYDDATAFRRHLELTRTIAAHSAEIADLDGITVIGPAAELASLDDVLASYGATTVPVAVGFRRD